MVHTRSGAGHEPLQQDLVAQAPAAATCPVCCTDVPFFFAALCANAHPTCIPCTLAVIHHTATHTTCPICRDPRGWSVPYGPGYAERLKVFVNRHQQTFNDSQ